MLNNDYRTIATPDSYVSLDHYLNVAGSVRSSAVQKRFDIFQLAVQE